MPECRTYARALLSAVMTACFLSTLSTPIWAVAEELCLCPDAKMKDEHLALMNLMPLTAVTHTAARSGGWSAGSTWSTGTVPGAGSRVYIPNGISITYDVDSTAALQWVRVEGLLRFPVDRSTRMVTDTVGVMSIGELLIGTPAEPLPAQHQAHILFTDGGALSQTTDPKLMGRGLITRGKTTIHGARKTSFTTMLPTVAGASTVTLSVVPHNWSVGDRIVICATHQPARRWNGSTMVWVGTEDEERTIAAINGVTVTLSAPLTYAHDVPQTTWNLRPYIANLSRNITFAMDTAGVPIQRRAHVMFMHSDKALVSWAAFAGLGRTDKSVPIDDPVTNLNGTPGNGSNTRGRYPVHIHRTGAGDPQSDPAVIRGCVVDGSPGWGIASHDSHAVVEDCVSYHVFGAHYVTEIGNELGAFRRNIAIKAEGDYSRHVKQDTTTHDFAFNGQGYWFQGRNMVVEDNVANSMNQAAFIYFHRSAIESPDQPTTSLRYPAIISQPTLHFDRVPIKAYKRNVAVAAGTALTVIKASPDQAHDQRSMFEDCLAWNVVEGTSIEYTAFYTFTNWRLIADKRTVSSTDYDNQWAHYGFNFGNNAHSMAFLNPQVIGWRDDRMLGMNENPSNPNGWVEFCNTDVAGGNIPMKDGHLWITNYRPGVQIHSASSALVANRLGFTPAPDETFNLDGLSGLGWSESQSFMLRGIKTDSIGSAPIKPMRFQGYDLRDLIAKGTYAANNRRYLPLEFLYFDRLTNKMAAFRFKLDVTKFAGESPLRGTMPSDVDSLFANAAPIARADSYTVGRDLQLDVARSAGLLANDTDADVGKLLQVEVPQTGAPARGKVAVNPNGSFTYLPDVGFVGTDTFSYVLSDGVAETATTVTVNITGSGGDTVNVPPTVALATPAGPFTAPAGIALSATASDADGSVAKVEFFSGATKLGEDTSATGGWTLAWPGVTAGSYSLTARATDNAGATTTSAAANLTVNSTPTALPAPWVASTFGGALPGSAVGSGDTATVRGSGADIWGSADAFSAANHTITGDATITVRVDSLTNTNAWAKAGIMIRNGTAADAVHAFVCVTPQSGVAFQRRTTAGGSSSHIAGSPAAAPRWLRLVRQGSTFTASESADGITWSTVGSANITMGASVQVMLAVTSHDAAVLGTAVFSRVTVAGTGNG